MFSEEVGAADSMTIIHRDALVPYSTKKMYDLVNDIPAYPEFLPWCRQATMCQHDPQIIEGTLELAKGGFHKTFTTRNHLQPCERIDMELVDGPFKTFVGHWHFAALAEEGCKVTFNLEFEFATKPLAIIATPIFQQIASSLVTHFCQRARELYGDNTP